MRQRLSFFLLFVSSLAFAGNNRSAVSLGGSDMNPCTPAAPCRSFSAAAAVTNAGGEIIALDSAGYGPFTISQAVTVSGAPGVHAAITSTTAAAIHVAAPSAFVRLRNLVLIGNGGTSGVEVGAVGVLDVSDLSISGFSDSGIFSFGGVLIADRCHITDIGTSAILFLNASGSISNSEIVANNIGIYVQQNSSVAITHCVVAKNSVGISSASSQNGQVTDTLVADSVIVGNSNGVGAGGSNGTSLLRLSSDVIFNNGTGVQGGAGATIDSYGNNDINGNAIDLAPGTSLTSVAQR